MLPITALLAMLPFFILTLVLHGDDFLFSIKKADVSLLVALPVFLFGIFYVGFRPLDAGSDTATYYAAFERIESIFGSVDEANTGSEFLFWPTQAILKIFFDERQLIAVNFLIALLLCYFAYKVIIKNSLFNPLLCSFLLLTYYAVYAGNAIRQAYAVPLIVAAFYYLYMNRRLLATCLFLLAVGYHWSAFVFLIAIVFSRLPNVSFLYWIMPLIGLFCAFFLNSIVDCVVLELPGTWVAEKLELYALGGRVTHHSGEAWQLVNFWICVVVYLVSLWQRVFLLQGGEVLMRYMLMVLTVMFFSIAYVDISERYMMYFLVVVPISIGFISQTIRLPNFVKNYLFLFSFYVLGAATFSRESAQVTLGM